MLDAMTYPQGAKISEIPSLNNVTCTIEDTTAYSCLERLHKGVCAIEKVVLKRVLLQEGDSIFVDGVDLSPSSLSATVTRCYLKSVAIFRELCMGFAIEEALVNFETPEYNDETYRDLLTYVLGNSTRQKQFFTATKPVKLNKRQQRNFCRNVNNLSRLRCL
jgi:hypothetical protein